MRWMLLALLSAGCFPGMAPGPKDATFEAGDDCLVFFYRDELFSGSAVSAKIYDDGKRIGNVPSGSFFVYRTEAGTHEFSADNSTRRVKCSAGKYVYVKVTAEPGVGMADFTLAIDKDDGRAAVGTLDYLVLREKGAPAKKKGPPSR
jgi:Protein of unknown function (DUF2846)